MSVKFRGFFFISTLRTSRTCKDRAVMKVLLGILPELTCSSDQPGHFKLWSEGNSETSWVTKKTLILFQRTLDLHYIKTASSIRWEREKRQQNEEAVYHQVSDLVKYIPEFKDLLPISPTKESVLCPEKIYLGLF